jgi:hypothetical protein
LEPRGETLEAPGLYSGPIGRSSGLGAGLYTLTQRERLAGRGAQLLLDQIDAVDQLSHRMLDLQAGVHLQEEERARVRCGDELDRAGALRTRIGV